MPVPTFHGGPAPMPAPQPTAAAAPSPTTTAHPTLTADQVTVPAPTRGQAAPAWGWLRVERNLF